MLVHVNATPLQPSIGNTTDQYDIRKYTLSSMGYGVGGVASQRGSRLIQCRAYHCDSSDTDTNYAMHSGQLTRSC